MNHDAFHLAIVTAGTCTVTAGDDRHTLHTYDKILVPAGLEPLMVTPAPTVEFLQCFPPS